MYSPLVHTCILAIGLVCVCGGGGGGGGGEEPH